MTNRESVQKKVSRITLLGSLLDFILAVLKISIGMIGKSHALVIDGIHSFSDLGTDLIVLVVARISREEPDENHPYGHGRFETLATVGMGSILLAIAGALIYETIYRIISNQMIPVPSWMTLGVAIFSLLSKEWIFHATKKVAIEVNSNLLLANAWHSRTDAISSLVVLLGLIGAMVGYPRLDLYASLVVALLIGKIGWDFSWSALKELADTSIDQKRIDAIGEVIMSVEGVKGYHNLRARKVGPRTVADVNVQVSPVISVSEGHEIVSWVAKRMREDFHDIDDVTVHADVEDDMAGAFDPNQLERLPLRPQIVAELEEVWEGIPAFLKRHNMNLHYRDDKVTVELFLREKIDTHTREEMIAKAKNLSWFNDLQVWYS